MQRKGVSNGNITTLPHVMYKGHTVPYWSSVVVLQGGDAPHFLYRSLRASNLVQGSSPFHSPGNHTSLPCYSFVNVQPFFYDVLMGDK